MSGVIWLIDAAYVLKGHTGRIDYIQMRNILARWAIPGLWGQFDRIIFYNSYRPQDFEKSQLFYEKMEQIGFELKLYPLKRMNVCCEKCGHCGDRFVQKGVDIAIATDLISCAYENKYQRIVLTAGDGDFLDAVKKVRSISKQVFLSCYRSSFCNNLVQEADAVYWF